MKAPAPLTIVDFRGDELEKARVSVAEATGAGRAEALRGAAGDLARQGVPQKEAVEVLQSACHQNGFIRERGLAAFQQTFADVKTLKLSDESSGYLIGAATQAYCPQYLSKAQQS